MRSLVCIIFSLRTILLLSFLLFCLFTLVSPTDSYLSNLRTFTCEYQNNIREFHTRLNANLSEEWTLENDPFAIQFQPYEQISPIRMLADTDNVVLEKVMKVFSALCFETDDLERIVCPSVFSLLFKRTIIGKIENLPAHPDIRSAARP